MNDAETKVMTFSSVLTSQVSITSDGSATLNLPLHSLINGGSTISTPITPSAGRVFFAGMMFDRLRVRSVSVILRPRIMPSSATAGNYLVYAAWDRYDGGFDPAVESSYSIQSDPSAKQVVWTPGGSGTPLRTYIYSTSRDKFQYFPISHNASLVSWTFGTSGLSGGASAPFYPTLLLSFNTVVGDTPVVVSFTVQSRLVLEFQGGYSNNTLNYSPAARSMDEADPAKLYELRRGQDLDSLTKRIQQFQMENPGEQ